jgi:hypothetical protein
MEFTFQNSYVILWFFPHYSEVLDRVHLVTQSILKQGYVARIDNISNTAGVLQEIGTAYYSLVST